MKKITWLVLAIIVGSCFATAATAGSATLTLADSYVTRGIVCNDEPVLQTFIDSPSWKGFGLEFFGNLDLTDNFDNSWNANEVDFMPKLTLVQDNGDSIVLGGAYYWFPNTEFESTVELFAKYISPYYNFTYWYDVDEVDGYYMSASVTPYYQINSQLSIGAIGTVGYANGGYNEFYFGVDESALNDTTLGAWVSLGYKSFIYTIAANQTWLLDKDIEAGAVDFYGRGDSFSVVTSVTWLF